MLKLWVKHKIFETSINMLFNGLIKNINMKTKLTLCASDLKPEHLNSKVVCIHNSPTDDHYKNIVNKRLQKADYVVCKGITENYSIALTSSIKFPNVTWYGMDVPAHLILTVDREWKE